MLTEEMKTLEEQKKLVEKYKKKYRPYIEALEKSPLARVTKGGLTESHVAGLIGNLQRYEFYQNKVLKEYGSVSDLGKLPTVAHDVITTSYGVDPSNVFAGNQVMKASHGSAYFKATKASSTRGNVTAGQTLRDPRKAPDVRAINYSGEGNNFTLGTTVAGTLTYTGTLPNVPVRKNTVNVSVSNSTTNYAEDNGRDFQAGVNNILGVGFYGSINHATGNIVITFTSDPGNGVVISVNYATNFEENGGYARVQNLWDSIPINAEVRALGMDVGLIQSFELENALGVDAESDSILTLSSEMVIENAQILINKMKNRAVGLTQWNKRTPTGTSDALHRITFDFALEDASGDINTNADRGYANVIIGGGRFCTYLATLDGFEHSGLPGSSPYIFGTYKGKIVIKATQLNQWEALMVYKGTNNFDVAAINSVYMPLAIMKHLPVFNNALKNQNACAMYNALEVVNSAFITRIEIIDQAYP